MNYKEALSCLEAASLRGSRMGLERISELIQRLGNPQNDVMIIHIAGTNGKGSVGAMLASVLMCAGYRTGHFSSPAITSPRDYFRINTEEISEELFAETLTEILFHAEQMADAPTEFELLAAMAYTLFARQGCDIAVVECCMGGDTDCTNVIDKPLLSIITNAAKDHCDYLGDTISEIAAHKAGIIKKGCPVLCDKYSSPTEALGVIQKRAKEAGAPLYYVRETFPEMKLCSCSLNGTDFIYRRNTFHIPLLGEYQADNACAVLRAVEILQEQGFDLSNQSVQEGLSNVRWHGRFELLHQDPVVIFDGAHNPDGMARIKDSMWAYFYGQKAVFLIGVMADKNYAVYPDILKNYAHHVFAVKPNNPRALDAEMLATVFREKGIPAESYTLLADGVHNAYNYAKEENLPMIAIGSLYLYKEFCDALQTIL